MREEIWRPFVVRITLVLTYLLLALWRISDLWQAAREGGTDQTSIRAAVIEGLGWSAALSYMIWGDGYLLFIASLRWFGRLVLGTIYIVLAGPEIIKEGISRKNSFSLLLGLIWLSFSMIAPFLLS